jgi:hypothetical protein
MPAPAPCAKHVTRAALRRLDQQSGNLLTRADLNSERLCASGCHVIRPDIQLHNRNTIRGDDCDDPVTATIPAVARKAATAGRFNAVECQAAERKSRFQPIWSTNGLFIRKRPLRMLRWP